MTTATEIANTATVNLVDHSNPDARQNCTECGYQVKRAYLSLDGRCATCRPSTPRAADRYADGSIIRPFPTTMCCGKPAINCNCRVTH